MAIEKKIKILEAQKIIQKSLSLTNSKSRQNHTYLSSFHNQSSFHNRSFEPIIFENSLESSMSWRRRGKSRNTQLFFAPLNLSGFGPIPFVDIVSCRGVFGLRIPARTEFVVTERVRLLTVPKLRFWVFDRGFRIATEKETNQRQKLFRKRENCVTRAERVWNPQWKGAKW